MENTILKEKLPMASELLTITTTLTVEEVGVKINELCEKITNVNVDTYKVPELKEYLKELKEDKKVYKDDRIGYFKPYKDVIDKFNLVDKALDNKAKEIEALIHIAETEEREAVELERLNILKSTYANFLSPEEITKLSKWECFVKHRNEYIAKEKQRNILTEKGALKKGEREKFETFLNNFTTALSVLNPIGMSKFESTLDVGEALKFQNEQEELFKIKAQKEEENRIAEEARIQALQNVKEEVIVTQTEIIKNNVEETIEENEPEFEIVETPEEVEVIEIMVEEPTPTVTVELYYERSPEMTTTLNKLFGELKELGIKFKLK